MKLIILAWLLTSTATPLQTMGIKAPDLPAWPGELPPAQQQSTGTFLPAPTDKAVSDRLIYLDHYPALCQSALSALDTLQRLESDPSFWDAYAWPVTAVTGGLVAGWVIGYKLR